MNTVLVVAAERSWDEVPGAKLVGILMGIAFLFIAIRMMFGKRK